MPPVKRPRAPVACRRCKSRKQRCDGASPRCGNCEKSNHECVFDREFFRPPDQKVSAYIASLEEQVANLQDQLERSTHKGNEFPDIAGLLPGVDRYYIGSTSGVSIVQTIHESMTVNISKDELFVTPPVRDQEPHKPHQQITSSTAVTEPELLSVFYEHCHSRYPVVDRTVIDALFTKPRKELGYWDTFLINVILAIGSRYIELMRMENHYHYTEMYYQRAREALSRARFGNYQYAQACMLCALYTHRARAHSSGPTVWHLTGMAMRAAVKVGLHRRQRVSDDQNPYEMEVNKRLFWSIYSLDRLLGHMLGRPFSIPEHDIDVQLPVDVEDSCTDYCYIQKLRMAQEVGEIIPTKVSAMTCLIHVIKLRQIESQIQASLYAVNPSSLQIPRAEGILEARLDEWFKQTPPRSLLDSPGMVGYDYVYLNYCRAKRLLLSPQFNALDSLRLNMSEPVFREYVALNGGICKAYKALHARGSLTYSPVALQTLFISGLALAYCLWLDHQGVGSDTIADIEACQTMLGVLAERWAHARNFKGVFDQLVTTINEPYSDSQARSAPDPSIFKPLPEDWFFGPLDFTFWDLSASVR